MSGSRERLPTLFEVLNRMSEPPVDLWGFYVFMRKNYRGVEYLDFWLDAANHVKLCQQYIKGLPNSGQYDGHELPLSSDGLRHSSGSSNGHLRHSGSSPNSSFLFNLVNAGDIGSPDPSTSYRRSGNTIVDSYGNRISAIDSQGNRVSLVDSHGNRISAVDSQGNRISLVDSQGNRISGFDELGSLDSSRNSRYGKRDTVARLSAMLDDFQRRHNTLPQLHDRTPLDEPFQEDNVLDRPASGSYSPVQPGSRPSSHQFVRPGSQRFSGSQNTSSGRSAHDQHPYNNTSGATQQHMQSSNGEQYASAAESVASADYEDFDGSLREPVLGGEYEQVPGGSPTRGSPTRGTPSRIGSPHRLSQQFGSNPFDSQPRQIPMGPAGPAGPVAASRGQRGVSGVSAASGQRSATNGSQRATVGIDPEKTMGPRVTLEYIYASVDRIVKLYLMPGAEREIVLPVHMAQRIREEAAGAGRRNPAIFNDARDYVFEVLEREAFPAFIASRALVNVRPHSALARLVVGLVALFGAFWLSFVFILLDWQPKYQRCWVILPFAVGWFLVISAIYNLDFLLGLVGLGESEKLSVTRIKEPYVKKLVMGRSLFVGGLTIVIAACFCVLFIFVPGHRL